jgi:hypothetical protein
MMLSLVPMDVFGRTASAAVVPPAPVVWQPGSPTNIVDRTFSVWVPANEYLGEWQRMIADVPTGAALGIGQHELSAASVVVTLESRNDNSRVEFRHLTGGTEVNSIRIRHSQDSGAGAPESGLTTQGTSVNRNNAGTAARRGEIGLERTSVQAINTATGGFWVDFDVRLQGYTGDNNDPQARFTLDLVILTQGGGTASHHYHPVSIRLASGPLTTVLGEAGVSIAMDSTVFIDHVNWSSAQNVSNITFTERREGELSRGNEVLRRRHVYLEAPVGYVWTMSTVNAELRGAFTHVNWTGITVDVIDNPPVRRNGIDYSVARITLPAFMVTRQAGTAGIGFGTITLTGLQMRPEAPNNIPIIIEGPKFGRIALLDTAGLTDWSPAGAWTRENVEMINQNVSGVIITTTVTSEATLRSGTRLAQVGGANEARNWNSATLRIAERGRGTFLPRFSFETQILTPGITVDAAQWRLVWADDFTEVAGWTNVQAHHISQNGRTVIFSIDNTTSRARAIAVEVRYRLHVEPNFEARFGTTDVDVQVLGVSAPHQAYVTRDEVRTIARVWDPITLSGFAPSFNVGAGVMAVAIDQELGDVTMTETRAGALTQDSFVDVFLVATLGGEIETAAISWGQSWFFRTNITGFLQGTNGLRLQPVGATPSNELPANVTNGFRFRVTRPSTGAPGSVTFEQNLLTGSMMNHPEIRFVLAVAGPAVTQNAFTPAAATPTNLLIPMPYTVIIGEAVQEDQGLGDQGPVIGGPGTTNQPGGNQPGNNQPLRQPAQFYVPQGQHRDNAPVFHFQNGSWFVQLRAIAGIINDFTGGPIENDVIWHEATASADITIRTQGNGTATITVTENSHVATYRTAGGASETRTITPPFIVPEHGRMYVPLSMLLTQFGWEISPPENGTFAVR